jgi:hypothetical protein
MEGEHPVTTTAIEEATATNIEVRISQSHE